MLDWDNPLGTKQNATTNEAIKLPTEAKADKAAEQSAEKPTAAAADKPKLAVVSGGSAPSPAASLASATQHVLGHEHAPNYQLGNVHQLEEKQANYTSKHASKTIRNTGSSTQPIHVDNKRVINADTDVNQLAPFKYPWAWEYFLNANKNHWTPLDVNMTQDIHDYHHKLNDAERHVYENVLAYLTTSDIIAMRNIGLAVMEKMTAPELQIYQARQVYEEALHTWTYQHCIETIGLDQGEIYNRYRVVPEINQKIQVANNRLNSVLRADIDLKDPDELNNFVMSYLFFSGIFEGCWFYNGFSPIFALQRRGLMKGTAEQLQYIMRDEVMHASFGIRVVKQIMIEENVTLDPAALRHMWDEAEAAESQYAGYILRDPILGYNAEEHTEQFRFIANRRARQIGIDEPFPGARDCFPWLDEQANMRKEKNFFETRVTEYQTGGALNWN